MHTGEKDEINTRAPARMSFPLPPHAVLRILDHDALLGKFIADLVGEGEVAGALGLGALVDQSLNLFFAEVSLGKQFGSGFVQAAFALGPVKGEASPLGVMIFQNGKDLVE